MERLSVRANSDPILNFLQGVQQIVLNDAIFYPQYKDKPVEFAHDVLGVEWTDAIKEIAISVLLNRKTAVPAGHAVGKTHGVAGIAIWWLSTRKTKIVTTAPTWRQVKDLIWRELRSQHRYSKQTLPGSPLTVGWDLAETWFATGISTRDSTRFQGYHAEELLVILDEACGVERFIWEAIEDGLAVADGNRILAIGNPTDPTGRFSQVCRDSSWKIFNLSCLDHPNIIQDKPVIRGAVSTAWVEERIRRWCIPVEAPTAETFIYKDQHYQPNDMFRVRVLGQFPTEGGSQVIPLHTVWNAFDQEPREPEGEAVFGFDIARFGDDMSVLTIGYENGVVIRIDPWQGARTTESTGRVKYWVGYCSRRGSRVKAIAADEIGVGSGCVDQLAEAGYPVLGINVSYKSSYEEEYLNLRSELLFALSDSLRAGELDLSRVEQYREVLAEELTAHTYDYVPRTGQRYVLPKAGVKEMIGRSPDFGDSLMLFNGYRFAGAMKPVTVKKAMSWREMEA